MPDQNSSKKNRRPLITFIVSLIAGAASIYVGAFFVLGVTDIAAALIAAFIGAIVWTVVGMLAGWIPLVGAIITLLTWVWVINWSYPGGWVDAGFIATLAWIVSVFIVYIVSALSGTEAEAMGVPGR